MSSLEIDDQADFSVYQMTQSSRESEIGVSVLSTQDQQFLVRVLYIYGSNAGT